MLPHSPSPAVNSEIAEVARMDETYDVVITRARLRSQPDRLVSIGIRDGRVAALTADELRGRTVLDAAGNLVTESFVDPHLHMCKVHTLPMVGDEAIRRYTQG